MSMGCMAVPCAAGEAPDPYRQQQEQRNYVEILL